MPPKIRSIAKPKTSLGRPKGQFTQHTKLSRLADLLERHPEGLSIPEMATSLRLTTRSVRRYLNFMKKRDAGQLESIAHGTHGALRWRWNPRDRGRAMNLRRTQAYALLSVRRAFDVLRGSALFEEIDIVTRQVMQLARRPVRAGAADIASDTRMEERFLHVPETTRTYAQKGAELDDLFRSVADLRVLTLRYAAGETAGDRGARLTLHPYAMILYRGAVHCIARDVKTGRVEAFLLERMSETEPSETLRFELPADFEVDAFVHGRFGLGPAKHTIVVEFDARSAEQIRSTRLHPSQRFGTSRDGRVRVSLSVPSIEEAARWVLEHGAAARVVEPPELRDAVTRELRNALARYAR